MADRMFERVLNQASAEATAEADAADPETERRRAEAREEAALRRLGDSMTVADACKRILLASKDRDYFRWGGGGWVDAAAAAGGGGGCVATGGQAGTVCCAVPAGTDPCPDLGRPRPLCRPRASCCSES